jgi:hypothetical protein
VCSWVLDCVGCSWVLDFTKAQGGFINCFNKLYAADSLILKFIRLHDKCAACPTDQRATQLPLALKQVSHHKNKVHNKSV